jgi:hypothetical protein
MTAPSNAARAAKLAAKYGPHIAAVVKVAGPTVKESVEVQRRRLTNRHAAFDKAGTVTEGSVLRQRDGDEVVFVVFSGEQPVAVYPQVATPIAELVRTADLSKRLTPEQFEAAKARARLARAARRAADRARPSRRQLTDPGPEA